MTRADAMKLVFRQHAVERMFQRGITVEEIEAVLDHGRIVESYPDDLPYPSALWLGKIRDRPIHVVAAENRDQQERIIITVRNL